MLAHCLLAGILAGTIALDPPGVGRRVTDAPGVAAQHLVEVEGPRSSDHETPSASTRPIKSTDELLSPSIATSQSQSHLRASRRLRTALPGLSGRDQSVARDGEGREQDDDGASPQLSAGATSYARWNARSAIASRLQGADEPPAQQPNAPSATDVSDLSSRAEQAQEQRRGDPESVPLWMEEGAALEALGDLAGAIAAYEQARGLLVAQIEPDGASPDSAALGEIDAKLEALRERARGIVEDEPESTHRQRLDDERAARLAERNPKGPVDEAPADPPKKERIVKKWYFWVTILAITASGAAVTGIAIQAARQDRLDDLDRSAPLGAGGGASLAPAERAALLRF